MKQEEISRLTRERMAYSLKKYMAKKPLEKITVREITEDCDLNRQTFYYHFQDIYDLTIWMFQQEAIELLKQSKSCETWQDGILLLLRYIQENVAVWICALNSLGRINLKSIFYQDAKHIVDLIINELIGDMKISDQYLQFLSDFYIDAVLGQVINWCIAETPLSADLLMHYLDVTLYGNLENALERAQAEHL
nr:TetR/AcrR family transcriptional regulator C-terminal domain-containing protein [uncultured Cellulosilyticum sp.]